MPLLLKRFLPALTGLAAFVLLTWQNFQASFYPWLFLASLIVFAFACGFLTWNRIGWKETVGKMLPPFLTLGLLGFCYLIANTDTERWILSLLFVGLSWFALELLFLFVYFPVRYPVHGLSRLNVGIVPVSAFLFVATLNGLSIFLRPPAWTVLLGSVLFGFILFFFTAHSSASDRHTFRWACLGALVGLHVGVLELLLPVSMMVHGALSALFFGFAVRLRRYAHAPHPSVRSAWSESVLALAVFTLVLGTAKWM